MANELQVFTNATFGQVRNIEVGGRVCFVVGMSLSPSWL